METQFDFKFTLVELNVILSGLGKLSYESSSKIIHRIQAEYQEQLTKLENAQREEAKNSKK